MGYRIGNVELGPVGIYDISAITGSMAAGLGANAPIFSIRWTSSTKKFVLERVSIDGIIATTGFTAGQAVFNLFKAQSFSVSDSAGTSLSPAAGMQKRLTSFADTAIAAGDVRISSTATLTAGTRTKDGKPFASQNLGFGTGTNTNLLGLTPVDLYNAQLRQAFPLILGANEGIILEATVPATGVWIANITVSWAETSPNIPI